MSIQDECEFHELDIRTQIGAIENMRGKVDSIKEALLSRRDYNDKSSNNDKALTATGTKNVLRDFDVQFKAMLNSSRYANYAEFMYGFVPDSATNDVDDKPITRKMVAVNESKLQKCKLPDEAMVNLNDDFLELESDVL
ncbi:MAG: hypothetical protein WCG50_09360, partial [Rhodoferax sp.]|uniref:hypothetical protein n=1 Tax=Rhodoferax sp. TaxID=50421 RepID=UPI0030163134